ncbi:MAG: DUF222 domain-containing protein, partial [Acidimicrobiia bacterium]
ENQLPQGSREGTHAAIGRFLELHAAWTKLQAEMLATLAQIGSDDAFTFEGQTGLVDWVVFETGAFRRTARAWINTATRLEDLPRTAGLLSAGRISFDHAHTAARFAEQAEPDRTFGSDDAHFAEMALAETADTMLRSARESQPPAEGHDREHRDRRHLRWWWDHDSLMHLDGLLPAGDGAVVELALRRIAARAPRDPSTGLYEDANHRHADALVAMASGVLGDETADHGPDLATVVVHVDADALSERAAMGRLDNGSLVGPDAVDRLLCDARLNVVAHNEQGSSVGVGRTSRRIPHWLRRTLEDRDRGCRFPGCSRTRRTHAHHIEHWAHGGSTTLDNLAILCGFHHRLVHEEGWRIVGHPDRDLRVFAPAGHRITPRRSYHNEAPEAEDELLMALADSLAAGRMRAPPDSDSPQRNRDPEEPVQRRRHRAPAAEDELSMAFADSLAAGRMRAPP